LLVPRGEETEKKNFGGGEIETTTKEKVKKDISPGVQRSGAEKGRLSKNLGVQIIDHPHFGPHVGEIEVMETIKSRGNPAKGHQACPEWKKGGRVERGTRGPAPLEDEKDLQGVRKVRGKLKEDSAMSDLGDRLRYNRLEFQTSVESSFKEP